MNYNKLLKKQIEKHLKGKFLDQPEIVQLLNAVNESYTAFERDGELSVKAFQISKQEYLGVNHQLLEEIETRKKSVNELNDAVSLISEKEINVSSDDLLKISQTIKEQIDKRKIAETELTLQKQFFEDILNNIPADIAVFNSHHTYLFINPKAVADPELRAWMIGKNDFDYFARKGLGDAIAVKRRAMFNHAIETNTALEWIDEHKNKEGEPVYVLRKLYPYFENNALKLVIGYGIDITDRRKTELKLEATLVEMEKANKELEQFAYIASHDLQEPLRMITSFLGLIEKEYNSIIDENGKLYIHFAVDGARRMRQIILDLLEFSRVGKSDYKLEYVDLNEMVITVETLLLNSIKEKNAHIVVKNQLPVIRSQKTQIQSVIQNLLSNALKYQREDTVPNIEISCLETESDWQICVADNGLGIAADYFEQIFVIFQRLHGRDQYSGTGIGLAITKKIVENWGGKIWVQSELGIGSSFFFTLPKL